MRAILLLALILQLLSAQAAFAGKITGTNFIADIVVGNGGTTQSGSFFDASFCVGRGGLADLGSKCSLCLTSSTTSDNSDNSWHPADQNINVSCTAATECGCIYTNYCTNPYGGAPCPPGTQTNTPFFANIPCVDGANCQTVLRYQTTNYGMLEPVKESKTVKIDKALPATADNADPLWHPDDRLISLSAADTGGSGVNFTKYCVDNEGGACTPDKAGNSVPVTCAPGSDCRQIVRYYSADLVGNTEAVKASNVTKIDKTIPKILSLSGHPDPFSPDGNGVKDRLAINFSTDEEADGTGYNATILIHPAGLSSVARTLVKDKGVNAGAHLELWNGTGDSGLALADGSYVYNLTVTDRVGHRNSSVGLVYLDLTDPVFAQWGASSSLVELGDPVVFSASLLDRSGIDSVFVCGTSSNCRDGTNMLCRMENATGYRDRFSCTFAPQPIGTYTYYIFANDTQNLFSNASVSFRVRNTTLGAPGVSQPVVDMQSKVRIEVNYLENGTYPVANANCMLSGDASGAFSGTTNPYYIELYPPKAERVDFFVTCSAGGFPSRTVSGFFTGRDLNVELSYEDVPIAANYTNYLYASVSTINDYSSVNVSADVHNFSVSGGGETFSGDMSWDGSLGKWVAGFTPTRYGAYSARVDFKKDGIDGSRALSMTSEKSLEVGFDAAPSLSVDLGSSAVLKLYIRNKGGRDRLYNVTFSGDLFPAVVFDGEQLSGRKDSRLVFIPADTSQEHTMLVKGLEVSPYERSFSFRVANVEKPKVFEEGGVTYRVVSVAGDRKFAPDLDLASVLLLLVLGLLYMRSTLPLACRQKNSGR